MVSYLKTNIDWHIKEWKRSWGRLGSFLLLYFNYYYFFLIWNCFPWSVPKCWHNDVFLCGVWYLILIPDFWYLHLIFDTSFRSHSWNQTSFVQYRRAQVNFMWWWQNSEVLGHRKRSGNQENWFDQSCWWHWTLQRSRHPYRGSWTDCFLFQFWNFWKNQGSKPANNCIYRLFVRTYSSHVFTNFETTNLDFYLLKFI